MALVGSVGSMIGSSMSLFLQDMSSGVTLEMPLTPEEFILNKDLNNEIINVVYTGEINRQSQGPKLNTLSLKFKIPVNLTRRWAYWTGRHINYPTADGGNYYISAIERMHDQHHVVRIILAGTTMDGVFIIDRFNKGFVNGYNGEWDVDLECTQWVSYAPGVVNQMWGFGNGAI